MARPKEFEREVALKAAVQVFADHGFGGTSTETLLRAMGISRQSMYDTFGDKRKLYLEALQFYVVDSISGQMRVLNTGATPFKGLLSFMDYAVAQAIIDPEPKCLGVAAVCEFGRSDHEISMITEMAQKALLSALERRISEAKAEGEIAASLDAKAIAVFLLANITGIKVAARAGAPAQTLRDIATLALRNLG
ncbi:HTH-type transcriptional repressor ComR [compost metagenome]